LLKRRALKNIYSSLLVLAHYGDEGEFMSLIRAAKKHFDFYKIVKPKLKASGNVYNLAEYRKQRE